jgi:hypothetical protein
MVDMVSEMREMFSCGVTGLHLRRVWLEGYSIIMIIN